MGSLGGQRGQYVMIVVDQIFGSFCEKPILFETNYFVAEHLKPYPITKYLKYSFRFSNKIA